MITKFSIYDLVMIGLMTALICVVAPLSIPIGFSPVPVTLATVTIYLSAMVLGPAKSALSCFIYLALGTVGLPVFSGFTGGVHRLLGPTGGYLIGYLFISLFTGLFVIKSLSKWYLCLLGMFLGTAACYLLGTVWLSAQMQISFWEGLVIGVVPYIVVDILKIFFALVIGIPLRKTLVRNSIIN